MKIKVPEVLDTVETNADYAIRVCENIDRVIRNLIKSQKRLIELKGKESTYRNAFALTLVDIFGGENKAAQILEGEALKAIELTEEYDKGIFKDSLIEAIYDPRTIKLERNRFTIKTHIALSRTAGDLGNWARAIEEVRENYGWGEGDPQKASKYWANVIYETDKYYSTIRERLGVAGQKAPWWGLLDRGNGINLASSYGGIPYPAIEPTRFVSKAREKINYLAYNLFSENLKEIQAKIQIGQNKISDMIINLNKQKDIISRGLDTHIAKVRISTAEQIIKGKFIAQPLNPERVRLLAEKLATGKELPERFTVGTNLDGKKLRAYTLPLKKLYDDLIK